jgi:hypothetical protein
MNKLELTLIGMAQQQLSAVLRFHEKQRSGIATDDDHDDHLRDSGALSVLLELGHASDSGMGVDAVNAMLEVEAKHSAAVRAAHPLAKIASNELILSDVGPSWYKLLPDVERWATLMAAQARSEMRGQISASVWPYRMGVDQEYLSVDMIGSEGGDLAITFGVGGVTSTEYDFDNLAGNTCFNVPDMTEALCMATALLKKLSASVELLSRD